MFQAVRVPEWCIEWHSDARYYGRKWCLHIGPWLVFIWPCEPHP